MKAFQAILFILVLNSASFSQDKPLPAQHWDMVKQFLTEQKGLSYLWLSKR